MISDIANIIYYLASIVFILSYIIKLWRLKNTPQLLVEALMPKDNVQKLIVGSRIGIIGVKLAKIFKAFKDRPSDDVELASIEILENAVDQVNVNLSRRDLS